MKRTPGPRAEVIVTARGEKRENLMATVESLCRTIGPRDRVRIVHDGEQHAGTWTGVVTAESPWKTARGCGQARDYGITTSKARFVAVVDAHMAFPAGWLDAACAYLDDNPRAIVCTQNQSVNHKWEPFAEIDSGAHLHMHTVEPQTEYYGPRQEYHGLSAKWRKGPAPGRVAAPMGACYVMRRDWYAGMGRPLTILDGWGCDEEIIGVAAYLCGGHVECLPVVTRHMYAAPRIGRAVDVAQRWANRLAMHLAIPGLPAETIPYMRQTAIPWNEVDRLVEARKDRIEALRAHLAAQKRTFGDMVADGFVTVNAAKMVERPAPVADPRLAPPAVGPVCPRCDRGGMRRHRTAVETLWRCEACGHRRAV